MLSLINCLLGDIFLTNVFLTFELFVLYFISTFIPGLEVEFYSVIILIIYFFTTR